MKPEALRNGYTTGSCAAAAAKAAALFLFTGRLPQSVSITLPGGERPAWEVFRGTGEFSGFCFVRKDAGDDPDVTDKCLVYARVSALSGEAFRKLLTDGKGYWLEAYPGLYLDGGPGIGLATLPGLSCPVGHYAINPVPRSMILSEVDEVRKQQGSGQSLLVRIAIPEGIALAAKTFNPRLGVLGGISVLGTTGIVRPMSEEAMLDTIRLDIRQKHLTHPGLLIMTPGNYGENFLAKKLGIPFRQAVVCSNFAGAAMEILQAEGVRQLLFVGHIGKLVKVAAGMPNTHSRYGDHRMETLAKLLAECSRARTLSEDPARPGGEGLMDTGALCRKVLAANTTEEALGYLLSVPSFCGGESLAEDVLQAAACAAAGNLKAWGGNCFRVETVAFSSALQISGATSGAARFSAEASAWNTGRKS